MPKFFKDKKSELLFLGICTIMCIIIFRKYIFGDSYLIYSSMPQADTLSSYFPYYKYFADAITNGNFSFWSFEMGVGTSTLSVFSYLFDPFNIFYILFGSKNIPSVIVYVAILKILVSGFFFYKYIIIVTKNKYISLLTGLLYAFSGYMIAWGQHYFFATFFVFVAVILYFTEQWISNNKKWVGLSISILFAAISNPYLLFMFSLYLFPYVILRLAILFEISNWRMIIKKFVRLVGAYILGIGCAAFLFLPIIYTILNSPRIGSTGLHIFSYRKGLIEYISLLKIFSQNIFGVADKIPVPFDKWHIYYEMPVLYSGLLTLIIIPQIIGRLKNEKKFVIYIFGIALSVVSLITPFFAQMFNMFKAYNFRWSFVIICFNLLVFAEMMNYLISTKEIKTSITKKTVFAYLLILGPLLVCLTVLYFFKIIVIDFSIIQEILKVIIFIILYYFMMNIFFSGRHFSVKKVVLLCIICTELITFANTTINSGNMINREYIQNKQGYYDNTNEIISSIKEMEQDKFYRINKNYISQSENDPLMQNYHGLTSYNSVQTKSYIEFLNSMGIPSKVGAAAVITGIDETHPYLLNLLNVKYSIIKTGNPSYMYNYPGDTLGYLPQSYKKIKDFEGYTLYENSNSLPLGITFNKMLDYDTFQQLEPQEKQKALMYGFVSEDRDLNEQFQKDSQNMNHFEYVKLSQQPVITGCDVNWDDYPNSLKLFVNTENAVIKIKTPRSDFAESSLQFELESPVQFDISSRIIRNNSQIQDLKTFIATGKYVYSIPISGDSDEIELKLNSIKDSNILISNINLIGESKTNNSVIDDLKNNAVNIKYFSNTKIQSDIQISEDRMALFAIPYDRGWNCKVNGKKANLYNIDMGLIGVPLSKGYSDIVLYYVPPFLNIGIGISAISFIILMVIVIANRRKSKTKTIHKGYTH